jgi:hypothetical protein
VDFMTDGEEGDDLPDDQLQDDDTQGTDLEGRNERREAAREKARVLREEHRKRERRNRLVLRSGIGVVIIAIIAIVVVVIIGNVPSPGKGPVNMASDGILLGKDFKAVHTAAIPANGKPVATVRDKKSSVISIRIYLDYFCPSCKAFLQANGDQLASEMKSGAATVEIHPISLLDRSSLGSQYSTRSAAAAGCVATYAPSDYWAWTREMLAKQPKVGTAGLSDAQIIGVMTTANVSNIAKITSCMNARTYTSWVTAATDRATTGPLPDANIPAASSTTITVLVDGKQYAASNWGSAADFAAFMLQAASSNLTSTATPTPTPTATGTATPSATPTP